MLQRNNITRDENHGKMRIMLSGISDARERLLRGLHSNL